MRKIFLLLCMAFVSFSAMNAQTKLYLDLSFDLNGWNSSDAVSQAWIWDPSPSQWTPKFTLVPGEKAIYETTIPAGTWAKAIIVRRDPGNVESGTSWDKPAWNQTVTISLGSSNCVKMLNWDKNGSDLSGYSLENYTPPLAIPDGTYFYLDPDGEYPIGEEWMLGNERYAVYFFDNDGHEAWVDMELVEGTVYGAKAPAGTTWYGLIYCRMDGTNPVNSFDKPAEGPLWNQTDDIRYDGTNNFMKIGEGPGYFEPVGNSIKLISPQATFIKGNAAAIQAKFAGAAAIELYTINGMLLNKVAAVDSFEQTGLASGLYIVKINGKASKVLVK